MKITLTDPLPSGRFTDPFGDRGYVPGLGNLGFHNGLDKAAPAGTPIFAAHDGIVSRRWWDTFKGGRPAGGNMVEIVSGRYKTQYAHMQSRTPLSVGTRVTGAVTVVGYVGATGAATGNHLHFSLLYDNTYIDPKPYIVEHTDLETEEMPLVIWKRTNNIEKYALIGINPRTAGNFIETGDAELAKEYEEMAGKKKVKVRNTTYNMLKKQARRKL